MDHTPFGASCVKDQWLYLGAICRTCASQDMPRRPARMDIDCFYLMRKGTWGKAMRKMESRALTVDHIHASPGRRAAIWNAYLASLIPYPAHVTVPDRTIETLMTSHFRAAVGLGGVAWAPHFILAGLGLLFQVPGAPRCPVAHARAIGALARVRDDVWGPPHARTLA